jgi:lysophospholipase L1-like esterase
MVSPFKNGLEITSRLGLRLILVLCFVAYLRAEAVETQFSPTHYLAHVSALLTQQWPTNRTVNILCHGHSVPAGYFKTPIVDTFNAYPHLLHQSLKKKYPYAVVNVIVTAIGGENSEAGAKRFEKDVLNHNPDVVTIDYGLNDRAIGLARAAAAWRSMITNAVTKGVKIVLLTPTPDLKAKLDDPDDPLNQHATQIRALAAEYKVGLVDSLAAFEELRAKGEALADYMAQANHPNRKGHEIVARLLMEGFE